MAFIEDSAGERPSSDVTTTAKNERDDLAQSIG
jgi:hypothetical protein